MSQHNQHSQPVDCYNQPLNVGDEVVFCTKSYKNPNNVEATEAMHLIKGKIVKLNKVRHLIEFVKGVNRYNWTTNTYNTTNTTQIAFVPQNLIYKI